MGGSAEFVLRVEYLLANTGCWRKGHLDNTVAVIKSAGRLVATAPRANLPPQRRVLLDEC